MAANHLRSGDIRVGDKLAIPGGKKQPDVPPAALPAPREQASKSAPKAPAAQAKAETGKPTVQAKAQTPPAPQPKAVATAAPAPSQPAPKAAPAKPTGKAVNYKVGPGETVWAIARKFNVEPASVMLDRFKKISLAAKGLAPEDSPFPAHPTFTPSLVVYACDNGELTQKRYETLAEGDSLTLPGRINWIRVVGIHDEEFVRAVAKRFGLHPLLVEDILDSGRRPVLEDYEELVFLLMQHIWMLK